MKVLIADDNTDDRSLLRCNLENHGCQTVIEAWDGAEALALAERHRPDLIISDALMPRMDGFQFLRAIKKDPVLKSIPFIFYSAVYTGYKEEELALSLGAEGFLVKPREPEDLWNAIVQIVAGRGAGRSVPGELKKEDEDFIRSYGEIVTAKLEERNRELEAALHRRKEAEHALRSQFHAINTVLDSMSAIVLVTDLDEDRLLFLNRQGCLLFEDDWKGKKRTAFIPEAHRRPAIVDEDFPAGKDEVFTFEFRDEKSGRWYRCMEKVIPWREGQPVRLAIAFDVSEQKELVRVKDEMLSAVSHEMRTPLTAMMGYMEVLLAREVPPAQQREYLQIIHRETENLHELIGNFLDLQRLQSFRESSAGFFPVDIGALLEETALRFRALTKKHHVSIDCPSELPRICGDPRDLQCMLNNLVSNAVKFSPDGGEVLLKARREGNQVKIVVGDQGIGIPGELLEKIFERFYQVDGSSRRPFGGTGLGLALVREVVGVHGGRVWAESDDNGSSFHILLPFRSNADESTSSRE